MKSSWGLDRRSIGCRFAALTLCFSAAIPVTAQAEISIRTNSTSYDVPGDQLAQAQMRMYEVTPIRDGDRRFGGRTDSDWSWSLKFKLVPEGCAVASVHVDLELMQTLPGWVDRSRATRPERVEWDRFLLSLRRHENEHAKIIGAGVTKLETTLRNLPPEDTCEQLTRNASFAAKATEIEIATANAILDRDTQHGATDGARLMADVGY